MQLARDYADLQQLDKAIDYLSRAMRMKNRPDGYILNLMGIYHGERGDHVRQERCFSEAAEVSRGSGIALFNLALAKRRRGELAAAWEIAKKSLERERLGPTLTLAGQLAEAQGNRNEHDQLLGEAIRVMRPLSAQGEWELGWLKTAARMASDSQLEGKVDRELQKRTRAPDRGFEQGGLRPVKET